jgi:hypothetical protein
MSRKVQFDHYGPADVLRVVHVPRSSADGQVLVRGAAAGINPGEIAIRKGAVERITIESLNYQLRKVTKARGHFPSDDAVVKLLWLAIVNIEDKRAREREARRRESGKRSDQPARMVEGQRVMGWREALNELDLAYPGRLR